jgi:hypothetical protein
MNNPFDKKIPDANKLANDQTSKAQGFGEGKLNDAKGFSDGKVNDAKGFGDGKVNDAKGFGEGKVNDAKGFGEGKMNDAKGFGEGKMNDAKGFGEGKMNDAKGFGEGKFNDTKGFGECKYNDVKGFGNNFSSPAGNNGAGVDNASFFSNKGGENKITGGSSGASGSSFGSAGSKDNAAMSGGAVQNKESSVGGSGTQSFSSTGTAQGSAGSQSATSAAPKANGSGTGQNASAAGSGGDKKKSEPKIYIIKPGEDLGIIAKKFRLPSWKYLYQLNKDKIGDNPDLLKAGTELTIPQWDSTSGDELIREKGADPMAYTGGLQYRYPWVPYSVSLVDISGEALGDFEDERPYQIIDTKTSRVVAEGTIRSGTELEILIPDVPSVRCKIQGIRSIRR